MTLALALLPAVARAAPPQQAPITLPSVEVDLWPEYDQPSTLVIYKMTLPAGLTLPADVTLRIPARVGKPNAVASKQADGNLVNANYTQTNGNDWSTLTIKATTLEIQLEYYDPGLSKNGQARSFKYEWPGDYAVSALTIQVQQPVGASDMKITPSLGTGAPSTGGLVFYTSSLGSKPAGDKTTVTFEYQKATDGLSSASLPVEAAGGLGPSSTPIAGSSGLPSWAIPAVLAVAAALLIVGGVFLYRQMSVGQPQSARKRHKSAGDREESPLAADGSGVYCHQCGKRAGPGDRFCRTCGTQLRLG
jgi:hypothetical protein